MNQLDSFGPAARTGIGEPRFRVPSLVLADLLHHVHHPAVDVTVVGGDVTITANGQPVTRTSLKDLIDLLYRARVAEQGIPDAVTAWLEHRPVTADEARSHGVLTLDWVAASRGELRWGVTVPRTPHVAVQYRPEDTVTESAALFAAATARARIITCGADTTGPVTTLSTQPADMATAALAAPDRYGILDSHSCVAAPHSALGYGSEQAVARLVDGIAEPYIVFTPGDLPPLPDGDTGRPAVRR